MSTPCRHHQERFGLGIPALRRSLYEEAADFLRALGTSGLARADDGEPRSPQRIREQRSLARFPRALAALQRDEASAAQRLPQTR